jgi:hypothetical protein
MVLGKKSRKWLEEAKKYTDNPSGIYPGIKSKWAPGVFRKLFSAGYVENYIPHNPIHDPRLVITDVGRKALKDA